jgi:hypothetical protein
MPDREVYFFDDDELWGLGREWYARNFQHDKPHVIAIGQKTPGLLYLDWTHQRMRQVIPDARLIVLLRNPVDRLYSHWQHACRMSDETPGFEALIKRDLAKSADAPTDPMDKVQRGYYAVQLERLFVAYPREQVQIHISERLWRNAPEAYQRICEFIGVSYDPAIVPPPSRSRRVRYPPMDPKVRARLAELYKPHNMELYELLGVTIPEWET